MKNLSFGFLGFKEFTLLFIQNSIKPFIQIFIQNFIQNPTED